MARNTTTGRMTAEEVAEKHLNVDLEHQSFWQESIQVISKKVEAFEASVAKFF